MKALRIRPTAASDLGQLIGLDHTSTTDHVWQLELRREPRGPQVSASFREVRLPRPVKLAYPSHPSALAEEWKRKALMLTAVVESELVGYLALAEPRSGIAWITDLVVGPAFRRNGIGGELLEAARAWASEKSMGRIFMEMQSKNYPALMLAQKHAYEFCGYNDQYYSNQDITLLFARAL